MSRLANRDFYKAEVVRMYTEERKSMNKISSELKISDTTVKKLLTEAGIEMRHHGVSYYVTKNLFEKIDSHESAYWLGMLYADGSLHKKGYNIALDLKESDKEHVEAFSRFCLNGEVKITPHKQFKGDKEITSYVCNFSDPTAHANLIKLGCVPNKSLILTCPTKEQVPDEFFFSFLRGYIDGDGYIQWIHKSPHYSIQLVGTEAFLKGIVERFPWVNSHCTIAHDEGSISDKVFRMSIYSKKQVYAVLNKCYENNTVCLKRKYEKFMQIKEEMEKPN